MILFYGLFLSLHKMAGVPPSFSIINFGDLLVGCGISYFVESTYACVNSVEVIGGYFINWSQVLVVD